MSIRRRLALLIDPSLKVNDIERWKAYDASPWGRLESIDKRLLHLNTTLDRWSERTKPRKGRNIWCEHPELHPEVELVS